MSADLISKPSGRNASGRVYHRPEDDHHHSGGATMVGFFIYLMSDA